MDPNRFEEMRLRLQERVKPSRYQHSMGVSQTAEQLARIYGADEEAAAVAGLLHDWDKALSNKELQKKAKKLRLAPRKVRKAMPGVLHSYTAGATLGKEFPELSKKVLRAISRHTTGAVRMTDLDKIVFVADIIEPGRRFPDIDELRAVVGEVSLDELYYRTYRNTIMYLLESGMPVHPDSLKIWNALVAKREKTAEAKRAEQAD